MTLCILPFILILVSYADDIQFFKTGFNAIEIQVKGPLISCLNYCPIIWYYCGKRNSDKLEWINESRLCFIFNDCHSSYDKLLDNIDNWPSLHNHGIHDMLTLVYNSFHGLAPSYINELLIERNSSYNLRGKHSLSIPRVESTKYGLHSFRYCASKYWNMLPETTTTTTTTFLFQFSLDKLHYNLFTVLREIGAGSSNNQRARQLYLKLLSHYMFLNKQKN